MNEQIEKLFEQAESYAYDIVPVYQRCFPESIY
jgi:hypothetical protein